MNVLSAACLEANAGQETRGMSVVRAVIACDGDTEALSAWLW